MIMMIEFDRPDGRKPLVTMIHRLDRDAGSNGLMQVRRFTKQGCLVRIEYMNLDVDIQIRVQQATSLQMRCKKEGLRLRYCVAPERRVSSQLTKSRRRSSVNLISGY